MLTVPVSGAPASPPLPRSQSLLSRSQPYVFAFAVTMTTAWLSNIHGVRAPFIIAAALVAILGYIVLLTSPTIGGQYM